MGRGTGQCKSKAGALEDGDPGGTPGAGKTRRSNKRKWRKSKGYSLSASLESDLHRHDGDSLVTRGTPKNGPVLMSYSVTDLENKRSCTDRQDSFHLPTPPPPRDLVSEERCRNEWEEEDKKTAAIAEPEEELSCYSTPLKTPFSAPPSPPPIKITTHADVVIVPAPSLYLARSLTPPEPDSCSVDSFASIEVVSEVELTASTPILEGDKPSVTFLEPEELVSGSEVRFSSLNSDCSDVEPPVSHPVLEEDKPSVTFLEPEDSASKDKRMCGLQSGSGLQEAAQISPCQKRASVVISNRCSVPIPTNISNILASGLAPVAFLDLPLDVSDVNEEEEEVDLNIVQPPLIFSERPSPADFLQINSSKPSRIVSFSHELNADETPGLIKEADSCEGTTTEGRLATDAATPQPSSPLARESGADCGEHEDGRTHEIAQESRGESELRATISSSSIWPDDKAAPAASCRDDGGGTPSTADEEDMRAEPVVDNRTETEMEEEALRYMTVKQLRQMFLSNAAPPDIPHRGVAGSAPSVAAPAAKPAQSPPQATAAGTELKAAQEASKSGDSEPKVEVLPSPLGGENPGEKQSERPGSAITCQDRDASKELLNWEMEDAGSHQFNAESEQWEIGYECNNVEEAGEGNESRTGNVRENTEASRGEVWGVRIMDNYDRGSEEGEYVVAKDATSRGEVEALAGGEPEEQEGTDKSCEGSEGQSIGMQEEVDPGSYASMEEYHPEEESSVAPEAPKNEVLEGKCLEPYMERATEDKNSILPNSSDDGISSVKNSDLDQIRKLGGDDEELGEAVAPGTSRRTHVSFSLELVSHQEVEAQKSPDNFSSPSSEDDPPDSLTEKTPKLEMMPDQSNEFEEADAATLSDISPISDFAALPELPVEEEWASLAQEASACLGGRGLQEWGAVMAQGGRLTAYANEDEERTIMDDHTDVSFSLPTDPVKPSLDHHSYKEDMTDSCVDLTSPTPSQSTSTDSGRSWQQYALAQSGYTARLPPQGCSGSSEDEGAELEDSGEECYDSLEDLKRGVGLRRLPAVPPVLAVATPRTRELTRSQTFSSSPPVRGSSGRRKLPQVPPRAVSVTGREEQVEGREEPRSRRAVSVGRELPLVPGGRKSRFEGTRFEDKSRSPETSLDSGCHSFQSYGEETSVDPPSPEGTLLPRRNASNFLWVDFQEEKPAVVRRPKNHDRLVQAKKAQNRHSAPPGSLEPSLPAPVPSKKLSQGSRGRPQNLWPSKRSQSAQGSGPGTPVGE